jgi:hypothetical protein
LLRMYFPRNWEFGSALSKLGDFRGAGLNPQKSPPVGTPLVRIRKIVLRTPKLEI